MKALFTEIVTLSITGSIFVAAVMVLRLLFRKAPRWIFCLLWAMAALRLVLPLHIETELSLMPPAIIEGQAVDGAMSGFVGDTTVFYEGSADFEAALEAGRVPVAAPSGSFVVTRTGSLEAPVTLGEVLAWGWLAGAVLMVGYAFVSWWLLRRRISTAVRRQGNVWESELVDSPFVLGLLRPRIYLPFRLDPADRENVIAHEKAHLHRGDHWWKPLGFLLLSVYWFNPVMWAAYVLLCRDIEGACDEKVIGSMTKEQIRAYSRALLNCSVHRKRITACPLAFGETGTKQRIKTVMHYKKPAFWIVLAAVAASVVTAVLLLTDPAEEKPEETTEPTEMHQPQETAEPTVDPSQILGTWESQNGSSLWLDGGVFGIPYVWAQQVSVRQHPEDRSKFFFTYRFGCYGDGKKQGTPGDPETELLTLECAGFECVDYDGDGVTELLAQVADSRNPYRLYDLEDGQLMYLEGDTPDFQAPTGSWAGPNNRKLYSYEDYFAFERFFQDTGWLRETICSETGNFVPEIHNSRLYYYDHNQQKQVAIGGAVYGDLRILGTDDRHWIYCVEDSRELFRIDPMGRRQDLYFDPTGRLCAGDLDENFSHFNLEDWCNVAFFTAGAEGGYGIYRLHLPSGRIDLLTVASEPISMLGPISNYQVMFFQGDYVDSEKFYCVTEGKSWDLSSPDIALFQELLSSDRNVQVHKVEQQADGTYRVWYLPKTEYAYSSAMNWEEWVMVLEKTADGWQVLSNTQAVMPQ